MAGRAYAERRDRSGYVRSLRLSLSALVIVGTSLNGQGIAAAQAQSLLEAPSALLLPAAAFPAGAPQESQAQQTALPSPVQPSGQAGSSPAPPPGSPQAATPGGTALNAASRGNKSSQTSAANQPSAALPRCPRQGLNGTILFLPGKDYGPCQEQNPLQFIVDAGPVRPLTAREKGHLAVHGVVDPFNLATVTGFSAITIASDSHTAYGPGFRGFGKLAGYSFAGDVQGEFIGTFAIPVLTHEDPRYHRMPDAGISRRVLHAVVHTYVTQHDNGTLMPNYSALLGYPISAAISNLYVPGLQTNVRATAQRVAVGIVTDPAGAMIAEFLPDVAKHIHIHVIFMQQILNQVANTPAGTPP